MITISRGYAIWLIYASGKKKVSWSVIFHADVTDAVKLNEVSSQDHPNLIAKKSYHEWYR